MARVAVGHLGFEEIRSRFLEGCGDRDALVEVVRQGFEPQIPLGNNRFEVFGLFFLNEAKAQIAQCDFLFLQLFGIRFQVLLEVGEEFLHIDGTRREVDFLTVSEAEVHRGALPGGLRHDWFELAPVLEDLIEPLLFRSIRVLVFFHAFVPVLGRPGVLPPVLECFCKPVAGLFPVPRLGFFCDLFQQEDGVEFVRQFEPLDARGQACDGFVLAQGVELESPRFTFLVRFGLASVEIRTVLGQGLHAELIFGELRAACQHLVGPVRVRLDGLHEGPAPPLAVVSGVGEAFCQGIEDGVPRLVHRRALCSAEPPGIPFFRVGQGLEIAQDLQLPGAVIPPEPHQYVGEQKVEVSHAHMVGFGFEERKGLAHEL